MAALRNGKMGNILENNKSFCLAPWIHSYISPQGLRQLCCVAEHNFGTNKSLDEIWNNDEMKSIRKRMLSGIELPECARCNNKSVNPFPYRDYFNTQYDWKIDELLNLTKEDGTLDKLPMTFDYRTNVCNFKCKMCTEEFSSQIQSEKIKNGLDLSFNILNSEEREHSFKIIENEFDNEDILKNLLEIYWAGGEPMYWKTHWKTLDKLVTLGYAKNVIIRYNSNLSTIEYKGKLLTDYFKHFKLVEFYSSLDGTGNIGEWNRTGLDWNNWRNNFSKLIEYRNNNKNAQIKLAITVNTPTLFDFENLYELCKEFDVEPDFQTCYSTNATNLLSPKAFPKNIIKSIINNFINSHINDENYIINKFRNYAEFLINDYFFENDVTYKYDLKLGFKKIEYFEKNRPHSKINFADILAYDDNIFKFYKDINKLI